MSSDPEMFNKIVSLQKFFEEQIQIESFTSLNKSLSEKSWMKKIDEKIQSMNEDQMEVFILSYFEHVIFNLKEANKLQA